MRCLREDLILDWESVEDQRSVMGQVESYERALHQLRHPIVRKAAEDFPLPAVERKRESISGMANPMWWKVKIGSRWRGAVYVDEGGQAWLCAAGYRREGEGSDFYRRFMADVPARGADYFLPTEQDRVLLNLELKRELADDSVDARLHQWEMQLAVWVQSSAMTSLESGQVDTFSLDDAYGDPLARVSVVVEATQGGMCDVLMEVEPTNFAASSELDWAEHVMLCALDPTEQHWESTYLGKGRAYSAAAISINWLAEDSESDAGGRAVGQASPGTVAHYTHRERLVDCMVDGEAVRALCGKWFVPRQDPDTREVCPTCDLIITHMSPSD